MAASRPASCSPSVFWSAKKAEASSVIVVWQHCTNQAGAKSLWDKAVRAVLHVSCESHPVPAVIIQTDQPRTCFAGSSIIDCWTDAQGWIEPSRKGCQRVDRIWADIQSHLKSSSRVVITSLASLLEENSASAVAKWLAALRADKRIQQVVVLAHSSPQDNETLARLRPLFSVSLELYPLGRDELVACRIAGRFGDKKKQSVVEEVVRFSTNELLPVKVNQSQSSAKEESPEPVADDDDRDAIHQLTTFSLGLTKEEEAARSKLVLPFWKPEQRPEIHPEDEEEEEAVRINPKSTSSSKIYYEPDEGDDWDEEDPDDDLDF